jgi:hypothetical protein
MSREDLPTGSDAFPIGREALPRRPVALQTGRASRRTGRDALRTGRASRRTGRDALRGGIDARSKRQGAFPTGTAAFTKRIDTLQVRIDALQKQRSTFPAAADARTTRPSRKRRIATNSMTKSVRRPTIALALPRSVPALISYAQGIVIRMTRKPGPTSSRSPMRIRPRQPPSAVAASRRASYEWQDSADGGKTWVSAPSTLQAKGRRGAGTSRRMPRCISGESGPAPRAREVL